MNPTKKAAVSPTAKTNTVQVESYHDKRQAAIAKRRADMPKSYRATYDKAVSGASLRAAINAQCMECICWQREEVRLCTCLVCPLWAVRPYQEIPQDGHNEADSIAECTNDSQGVS